MTASPTWAASLPKLSPRTEVTGGAQALRLLMANPRYQLNCQGENPDGDPLMHGPYRFDHLSIDSYEPVDEAKELLLISAAQD